MAADIVEPHSCLSKSVSNYVAYYNPGMGKDAVAMMIQNIYEEFPHSSSSDLNSSLVKYQYGCNGPHPLSAVMVPRTDTATNLVYTFQQHSGYHGVNMP